MKVRMIRTPKGSVRVLASSRAKATQAAYNVRVTCPRCHEGTYHRHIIMVGK